jgi:hypothetical protein
MIDLRSRFGHPTSRRHKVNKAILLTLSFRSNGMIAAVDASPKGYNRLTPIRSGELPVAVAESILNELLPGSGVTFGGKAKTTWDVGFGISRSLLEMNGGTLLCDYCLGVRENRLMAAEFKVASMATFPVPRAFSWGLPEFESFSAELGVNLGVSYTSTGSIRSIRISTTVPPRLEGMNQDVAERLLEEIFPEAQRTGEATRNSLAHGTFRHESMKFENGSVMRSYSDCGLFSVAVVFGS